MYCTDEEILASFQKDMEKGGRLLFNRYYKPLVLFAETMLSESDLAEDIVQDVFYDFIHDKVFLRVTPEALSTWLFRCVKHACLNRQRDRKEICQADMLLYDVAEEEARTVSPELIADIHKAIRQLPEQTRKVISLVILRDRKYQEAADELHISINTVKSLLSSGLKTLRKQFPDNLFFLFMLRTEGGEMPELCDISGDCCR